LNMTQVRFGLFADRINERSIMPLDIRPTQDTGVLA